VIICEIIVHLLVTVQNKKNPANVVIEPEIVGRQYLEDIQVDRNCTVEAIGESVKKMENSRSGGFRGTPL
jgi:hypothetical protein